MRTMNYNPRLAYLHLCELAEVRPMTIEDLLFEYERAILDGWNRKTIDTLCLHVELEADRIGFTDHKRLKALHTMAEQRTTHH